MKSTEHTRRPADEHYDALATRLQDLYREAGAMLAQSFSGTSPHPDTARQIAESFAREANEVRAQMASWRLANGYDQ